MKTHCRLCKAITLGPAVERWNQQLMESPNFVVLPSVGAMVEGWLLIIPKDHYLSAAAMPYVLVEELHELKDDVAHILAPLFGSIVAFEHGPSRPSCEIGCGVDHAHLHLVPFAGDLELLTRPQLPEDSVWEIISPADVTTFRDLDYLYFEQPLGSARITAGLNYGSQVFRRAVAGFMHRTDEYNWREFPEYERVFSTIAKLEEPFRKLAERWMNRSRKVA